MDENFRNNDEKEEGKTSPSDKENEFTIDPNSTWFEFENKVRERFRAGDTPITPSPIHSIQDNDSKNRKSLKLGILILITIGVGFGFYKYLGYRKDSQLKEEAEKQAISNMVTKFNAVTDWRGDLDDLEDPYSLDVEKILIREDKRPLFLSVYVRDIRTKDSKVYVNLYEAGSPAPEIRFMLECNSSQTEKFRDRNNDEFAVIASINSVTKFQSSETESESSNTFVANGQCLDLLPVNY
jgi:hypothetical protein